MSTSTRRESRPARPEKRRFLGQTTEERTRARRQELVKAGLETFGTDGFHAVGVRDVCAAARLTERYFYESFTNREALFLAVYEDAVERIRDAILRAIEKSGPDPEKIPRDALRAFLKALRDDPRLARIVLLDVLTVGVEAGNRSLIASQSFVDLVTGIVKSVYPDLAAQKLSPALVAQGLVGSSLFVAMQWATGGFREPLDRVLDHSVLFYEAVGNALGPPLAPRPVAARARRERRPGPPKKRERKNR